MKWVSALVFGISPSRVHYRCAGSDDIGHLTAAERTSVVDAKRHAKSHSDTPGHHAYTDADTNCDADAAPGPLRRPSGRARYQTPGR